MTRHSATARTTPTAVSAHLTIDRSSMPRCPRMTRVGSWRWAILLAALCRASTAAAQSVVEMDDANNTGYTVPTTALNLLSITNSATLSANPSTAAGNEGTATSWSVLTDGSFGTAGAIDGANDAVAHSNSTLTYTLNTGANPLGFSITNIDTYTGWQDGGRVNQDYSVFYSTVSNPTTFNSLATVAYNPGNTNSEHVDLATSLLSGVSAIRFVFNGQQNGYVGYRELAVAGSPTPPPTVSTWNGGSATTDNWSDPANWGGSAPVAANNLFFAGSTRVAPVNDIAANTQFASLTFSSGAAAYTLTGNAINLTGDLVNNSANLQTVNIPLAIASINLNAATGDLAIGGVISDISSGSAVTLPGPHKVTLTATNTYSGATTISGGTLQLGDGSTTNGSVAGDIVNNGTLAFANPANQTYGRIVSGSGNVNKSGAGTLTLANAFSSYAGTTNISGGSVRLGGANAHYTMDGPPGSISDGASITDSSLNGNTGTVVGSGASYVAGVPGKFAHAINLTPQSSYISVPDNPSLDLHTYTISTWFNLASVSGDGELGNPGKSNGVFDTRNGGNNTFDLKISAGVGGVATSIHGDVGAGGGNWINTNVDINGLSITAGAWHMLTYVVSPTGAQTYFDGVAKNAYSWNATPLLAQGGSLFIGNADNSAGGNFNGSLDDTYVIGSALTASQVAALYTDTSNANLPVTTPLTIGAGGSLDLNGNNQAALSLSGVSSAVVTNGGSGTSSILTLTPTATTSFAGVIQDGSGSTGLTINGPGLQELTGTNTFTGPTTVLGGTLRIASTGSLSAGTTVTIGGSGASGTPTLSGTGAANGAVQVNGPSGGVAGHIAPGINTSGNFGAIGTLTTGNLTLNSGAMLDFDFGAPGTGSGVNAGQSDRIAVAAALAFPATGSVTLNMADVGGLGVGTYKLFTFGSISDFSPTVISVGSSPLTGKSYSFTNTGSEIDLTIAIQSWALGATTSAWQTAANWTGGAIPGSTSSTTNTDTATFNINPTNPATLAVAPDSGRNVQYVVFDTASAGRYVIGTTGGNTLHLTTGGGIQTTSTVANTETVNAPFVIEGANATSTFTSGASDNTKVLNIGGSIAGNGAGTTVLTLNGSNTGPNTVSGVISDGGSGNQVAVVKDGAGTWVLNNANTFTGGTTISNGTLQLGDGATNNGSVVGNIANSGTLVFANPASQTYAGVISGAGAVNVNGPAPLIFTNINIGIGTTTINGPSLQLGDGLTGANNGNVGGNIVNKTSLIFANATNLSYGGVISGNGTLTKSGAGVLTLGGVHTYQGSTTVSAGTLQLGPSTSGVGALTIPNADFTTGTTAGSFTYNPTGASWTFLNNSGVVTNGDAFGVSNAPSGFAGFLQNSGNNGTFSQTINFPTAGSYAISFLLEGRPGDPATNPISVQFNGSTITGLSSVLPLNTTSFDSFSGVFPVLAPGNYSIGFTSLGSAVGLDQTTFVDNVAIAPYGALPSTTALTVANGATFDLNAGIQQVSSLAGPSGSIITNSNTLPGTIVVALPSGSSSFAGTIQDGAGQVALIVNGSGSLILSGANTYSGGTTVLSGTLTTTATGSIGSGPLVVSAADSITSTLNLGASQTVSSLSGTLAGSGSASVNVAAGTTLTVSQSGNTTFAGTLVNSGTVAKTDVGTLEFTGAPTLNNNSSLQANGGTLRFNVNSGAATVGSGVTAMVASGATLELAGSVSALSSGSNRVNIINNSQQVSGGMLLVSGTNQHVGAIDGTGDTVVNAGSDLTANHIIQNTLVIGGAAGNPGLVTIDASDASGNPLGQSSGFASAGSLTPSDPFGAGSISSANLSSGAGGGTGLAALSLGSSIGGGNPAPVPEPSTFLLALLAVLGLVGAQFARRYFRCQTV
jgi:fibronectin-binding autotransporter adhesin